MEITQISSVLSSLAPKTMSEIYNTNIWERSNILKQKSKFMVSVYWVNDGPILGF